MGFFDKFAQHIENSMPRGKHTEEVEMNPDGSLQVTVIPRKGQDPITYSLSPQEAEKSIQGYYQAKEAGK